MTAYEYTPEMAMDGIGQLPVLQLQIYKRFSVVVVDKVKHEMSLFVTKNVNESCLINAD